MIKMSEKICAPDGFEEEIDKALKNKEPCPAQVEYLLHDGETMAVYCDIGAIVNCEHKGPRRRFYEGDGEIDLCEINEHYTCLYNPGGEDKEPPLQRMKKPDFSFLASLTEKEVKRRFIKKGSDFEAYIYLMTVRLVIIYAVDMAIQAKASSELGVSNVALFDELISNLEEACAGEYKELCKKCRNAFYNSAFPIFIETPIAKVEEKINVAATNYYKELMKDKEDEKENF